jgi:hypothetical protein
MSDINVSAGQLRSYALYLHNTVIPDVSTIAGQAMAEGGSAAGFTGLLEPLKGAVSKLNDLSNQLCIAMQDKFDNLAEGLSVTADDYQHIDHANAKNILNQHHGGNRAE